MQENLDNRVELIGEDGVAVQFEHHLTLEHNGKSYAMLSPAEPENPDEEGMVLIMRLDTDEKGEECLIIEEDEAVVEEVFGHFMELMEEMEEED